MERRQRLQRDMLQPTLARQRVRAIPARALPSQSCHHQSLGRWRACQIDHGSRSRVRDYSAERHSEAPSLDRSRVRRKADRDGCSMKLTASTPEARDMARLKLARAGFAMGRDGGMFLQTPDRLQAMREAFPAKPSQILLGSLRREVSSDAQPSAPFEVRDARRAWLGSGKRDDPPAPSRNDCSSSVWRDISRDRREVRMPDRSSLFRLQSERHGTESAASRARCRDARTGRIRRMEASRWLEAAAGLRAGDRQSKVVKRRLERGGASSVAASATEAGSERDHSVVHISARHPAKHG